MTAWLQMHSKRAILLLLFLILPALSGSVLAQSGNGRTGAVTPRLDDLQEKGSEALFNLDYEVARQRFKEMARLYPDDPTGPHMLATTLWLETLNQARRLQAAIYSTQSFYAGTEDKPDPRLLQDFRDLTRRATQLAKARLQHNPRDLQTLYTMGTIDTLKGSFAATIERKFIAALRDGSSGVDRQREAISLAP